MGTMQKSYAQKLYVNSGSNCVLIEEVEKRNPELIVNDGLIQGFCFFDKEVDTDNDKSVDTRTLNYSNWIYFGKRFSLKEIKEQFSNILDYMLLINNINCSRCKSVCYTQMGNFLPMIEGDMTFDEYMDEKSKEVTLIKK